MQVVDFSSILNHTWRLSSKRLVWCAVDSAGMNSMNDEDEQQQQQQQPLSSPADNLPEWKSADPYLASILRHLRATDQHLDGTRCLLLTALTICNGNHRPIIIQNRVLYLYTARTNKWWDFSFRL